MEIWELIKSNLNYLEKKTLKKLQLKLLGINYIVLNPPLAKNIIAPNAIVATPI